MKTQTETSNRENNTQWLLDYQEDLIKIIGKHRKSNHALSVEEILSEVNNHFLEKHSDKEFIDEIDCNKFLYGVAKNWVRWTYIGVKHKDKDYNLKKNDSVIHTEEGQLTAFEYVCTTMGSEDDYFVDLNFCKRFENIYKWIFDYSHFLTEKQKTVLPYIMVGKTLDEIGDAMGITHQAVSSLVLKAFENIRQYIKVDLNQDNEAEIINQGQASVNYIFGSDRLDYRSSLNTKLKNQP